MRCKRVEKLRRELQQLRNSSGPVKRRILVALVEKLERKRQDRGKEPTWECMHNERYPITIPAHTEVKSGTAKNILNSIESDLDYLEDRCTDEGDEE